MDRGLTLDEPDSTGEDMEPISYAKMSRPRRAAPRLERSPSAYEVVRALESRYDSVDRALESLELANIAFNAPGRMNLKETQIIQLTVGLSQTIEELKQRIAGEGEIQGHRIRVSERMEARLTGQNFAITAITPEVQAVGRVDATEWKWEVLPQSEGSHHLHLTLTALIEVEGKQTQRAIRTFDHNISIYVTWQQELADLFKRYWQWLWAAILLPLFGWGVKKWRERRKGNRA